MPTFRRKALLATVLQPLLADPAAAEVVVAHDGGDDGTEELLQHLASTHEHLVPLNLAHGGRQAARRAGIEAASGDVVLLVDDDVHAEEGLVTGHADAHAAGAAEVISGYMPVLLPPRRRPGMAPTFLYAAEYEKHCAAVEADAGSSLFTLWGGNLSLPRELALDVTSGAEFPASFGEDTHMGLLCHRRGATGRFVRSLRARHLHSRTQAQFLRDSFEQGRGRYWLHHLHGDLLGPPDMSYYTASLSPDLRWLVERHRGLTARAGSTVARLGGATRLYTAETAAVKLLRRAAAQEGMEHARCQARGRPPEKGNRGS